MKHLKTQIRLAIFGIVMVLAMYVAMQLPDIRTMVIPEESSLAAADETDRIAQLEAQVEALSQDKARLTEELDAYRAQANEVCILVLRYEELFLSGIFGDAIVIERAVQEIAVSRALYESCRAGDDITSLELHRLITCSGLSDTRVIVESKYIRT